MKTSKRLLSLLLALTMVLSLMGNLSVAAFAEEVTPTVVTTDGNDQPTTPVIPDEGQTTPANADKSGGETPAPANGDANAEPVPAEGEVTTPAVAVPKLKDGVSPTASATVQTGTAYLLSDLQAGKIFDGEGLTYENYYYERSADNGQSWGTRQKFEKALFGSTLIQLTETVAGTYIYRFYASFDGENFSTDTWTLTLTVEDNPTMEFSFFVGKDYTGGYPVIKLYNVTKDADGNEVLGGFLCQGRVNPRLVALAGKPVHHPMTPARAARLAEAARHPDGADRQALVRCWDRCRQGLPLPGADAAGELDGGHFFAWSAGAGCLS